jgi:Ser/Thr protein kinase RdoA (MazF antagonist)
MRSFSSMSEAVIQTERLRKITRPVVDAASATDLLLSHFAFDSDVSVSALDSYDDKNFRVVGKRVGESVQTFILKIHNGIDSVDQNLPFIEAMNLVMLHLQADGIYSNVPLPNTSGALTTLVTLPKVAL